MSASLLVEIISLRSVRNDSSVCVCALFPSEYQSVSLSASKNTSSMLNHSKT